MARGAGRFALLSDHGHPAHGRRCAAVARPSLRLPALCADPARHDDLGADRGRLQLLAARAARRYPGAVRAVAAGALGHPCVSRRPPSVAAPAVGALVASILVVGIALCTTNDDIAGLLADADRRRAAADRCRRRARRRVARLRPHRRRRPFLAAQADHAGQRRQPQGRLDLPHRRHEGPERLARDHRRGDAAQDRRHRLSLLAAPEGVRARCRDRQAEVGLRSAGEGQSRPSSTSPAAASPIMRRRRRADLERRPGPARMPAAPVPADQRRPHDRARRRDRQTLRKLRHARPGRSQRRHDRQDQGLLRGHLAAGRHQADGDHGGRGDRQLLDRRAVGRGARLRRLHRQADLGMGCRRDRRECAAVADASLHPQFAQQLVDLRGRREARPDLPADGRPGTRHLGRQPHADDGALRQRAGRARRQHGQARLVVPDGPSRSVGHGPALAAEPRRSAHAAGDRPGNLCADQVRQHLRARPPHGQAHRRRARAARPARRRTRRSPVADAALFRSHLPAQGAS